MNLAVVVSILALLTPLPGIAGYPGQQDPLSQEEMMQAYLDTMAPGEAHERLAGLAGSWTISNKMWLEPGQEAMISSGACENEMILGGRFLTSKCAGGEGEMYVENLFIIGFDRRWNQYTFVGYDTMGTYFVTAAGEYDSESRTITMYGEDEDPVLGFTQQYDIIMRLVSENEYVTEVIFKDDVHTRGEGPFKVVEVIAKRAS